MFFGEFLGGIARRQTVRAQLGEAGREASDRNERSRLTATLATHDDRELSLEATSPRPRGELTERVGLVLFVKLRHLAEDTGRARPEQRFEIRQQLR